MRFFKRSLFAQLFITLGIGFILLQIISVVHLYQTRDFYFTRLVVNDRAKNIATSTSIINMSYNIARARVIDNLKTNNLRLANTVDKVELEQGKDDLSLEFKEQVEFLLEDLRKNSVPPFNLHNYTIITKVTSNLNPLKNIFYNKGDAEGIYSQAVIQLFDGTWLYFSDISPLANFQPQSPFHFLFLAFSLCTSIGLFMAFIIAKPLKTLSDSAKDFSKNLDNPQYLEEKGPKEIREILHSYNLIQKKIVEFIDERERTLIAVSHDIRTPLTRMRLRIENLPNPQKENIIYDITEIEELIENTIYITRQSIKNEDAQLVDLASFIESIVYDRQDIGQNIELAMLNKDIPAKQIKTLSLKRCLNNLIDNALRYANNAKVSLYIEDKHIIISVEDDGPGIAKQHLDDAFKPFFRAESSRNKNSGGLGLGLPIAKEMAELNDAKVILKNIKPNGLKASIVFN